MRSNLHQLFLKLPKFIQAFFIYTKCSNEILFRWLSLFRHCKNETVSLNKWLSKRLMFRNTESSKEDFQKEVYRGFGDILKKIQQSKSSHIFSNSWFAVCSQFKLYLTNSISWISVFTVSQEIISMICYKSSKLSFLYW